ncbi:MAG TPA: hypothetical protein VF774_04875 [Pseudoduganella sp.]
MHEQDQRITARAVVVLRHEQVVLERFTGLRIAELALQEIVHDQVAHAARGNGFAARRHDRCRCRPVKRGGTARPAARFARPAIAGPATAWLAGPVARLARCLLRQRGAGVAGRQLDDDEAPRRRVVRRIVGGAGKYCGGRAPFDMEVARCQPGTIEHDWPYSMATAVRRIPSPNTSVMALARRGLPRPPLAASTGAPMAWSTPAPAATIRNCRRVCMQVLPIR